MTGNTADLDFAALDTVLLAQEHSARVDEAQIANTKRLYYLASNLDLEDTPAAQWKPASQKIPGHL